MKNKNLSTVITLFLFFNFSVAQERTSYIYEIYKDNKKYNGEGINWLLEKHHNTQFYLFGEQHGVEGLSELVQFIYTSLNQEEKYNLLLEMDGWTCNMINELGTDEVIKKYPYSIAFDYDDYIALIKSSQSSLFGLDQMITSIHPLQRLAEIAPNENARRLSQGAYLKASLKMGKYLREAHFTDLEAIKNVFGKDISEEASQILESLEISMNIYVTYMKGQKGEIDAIVSDKMRETYMIKQFDRYLDKSKNTKAIIKMGGAHIMKGIGPNKVSTLGNHVIKFAKKKNSNALSVSMFKYNEELSFLKPTIFKNTNTVLIDCRSYLAQLTDTTEAQLTTSQKKILEGFDGIVLFNDAPNSEKTTIVPYEKTFKKGLIANLVFCGLLVLICLTSIISMLIYIFSKAKTELNYKIYGRFLIQFSIAFVIVLGIIILQFIGIFDTNVEIAEIDWASHSLWLFALLFLIAFYLLIRAYQILIKNLKKNQKAYMLFISLSFLFLIIYMYYWNIGGMISI